MNKLLLLSFITLLFSCDSVSIGAYKKVKFKPTQCANPWDFNGSEGEAVDRFKEYLFTNGITEIKSFRLSSDNKSYCEACSCEGRDTYTFSILKTEYDLLKTIPPFDQLD
ncbi:hypothetical protein [Jiulongibacter sp. NS-SX5]|uniref:hypothetical protein n=1 Tax=Jiulongibacter sp. NS-SX5 TaxID=3463854 RepID=UPI00405A0FA1